jgi:hypothetical protein
VGSSRDPVTTMQLLQVENQTWLQHMNAGMPLHPSVEQACISLIARVVGRSPTYPFVSRLSCSICACRLTLRSSAHVVNEVNSLIDWFRHFAPKSGHA